MPISEVSRAIFSGDCDKLDALVEAGLDVNAVTEVEKWNLLHRALVLIGRPPIPKMIKHLIDLGVDVNAQDQSQWTPLHYAVRTKNVEVVRLLIEAGTEVNVANDKGVTPLHLCLAEYRPNLEVFETLLAAGADPDFDGGGATTRKLAEIISCPESGAILALLKKYAGDARKPSRSRRRKRQ